MSLSVGDLVYPKKSSLSDFPKLNLLVGGGQIESIGDDGVALVAKTNRALSVEIHVSHLCKPTSPDALEPYID